VASKKNFRKLEGQTISEGLKSKKTRGGKKKTKKLCNFSPPGIKSLFAARVGRHKRENKGSKGDGPRSNKKNRNRSRKGKDEGVGVVGKKSKRETLPSPPGKFLNQSQSR